MSASFNLNRLVVWILQFRSDFRGMAKFVRDDGLTYAEIVDRLFDPKITIAKQKVGYFEDKVEALPFDRVPATEDELLQLCGRMVDERGDATHIGLMLSHLDGGLTLREHVASLWALRARDKQLFEDVVRGVHAQAILRYKSTRPRVIPLSDFKELLARHGLIWCAWDSQLVILGAKVTTERPFGPFLTSTGVVYGATVLRLMKQLHEALGLNHISFQTWAHRRKHGRVRPSRQKPASKKVEHELRKPGVFASLLARSPLSRSSLRVKLDDWWSGVEEGLAGASLMMKELERYNIDNGVEPARGNKHRTFQQIFHLNLRADASAAFTLMRFAMAEQQIRTMVDKAIGSPSDPHVRHVEIIGPPPPGLKRSSPLIQRTLDLLYSARRVQLLDINLQTRTPEDQRVFELREPDDFAGLRPTMRAYRTLLALGRRRISTKKRKRKKRLSKQEGYLHHDVIPEWRLRLTDDPNKITG